MKILAVATIALATAAARAGSGEEAAQRAWDALQAGAPQPEAQVRALVQALDAAGLRETATVALSVLAGQGGPAARSASEELQRRAEQGGLALSLLARTPPEQLAPAVAVRVARAHLEQALVLAPPEEGTAFAGMAPGGPALTPASASRKLAEDAPAEAPPTPAQRLARAELDRARRIAGQVRTGDAAEAEAHEVIALASLAAGDAGSAEKEFEAVARVPPRGGGVAVERHEKAILQLARLAYARGDDARAQALYGRVSRGSPQWLDALFEASWSHFRRGEDEKALGNLLTLHAPFFQGRYFPESYVLKALVLYENCRYVDARRALTDFEARYKPVHDGLLQALSQMPTAQAAVEQLASGPDPLLARMPEAARPEVARLLASPELKIALQQVRAMGAELDSMDGRAGFQRSAFAAAVLPQVRSARLDLLQVTGERARAAIAAERGELRELLGQSLRLGFEIAGREKELAAQPESAPSAAVQRRPPTQVDDDEEMWPFQGEYWRDELGSYRFQIGNRCTRAQPAAPVQQVQTTKPPPPAAAAAAEPAPGSR